MRQKARSAFSKPIMSGCEYINAFIQTTVNLAESIAVLLIVPQARTRR